MTGIPTDAKFAQKPDPLALKKKLGLQDGILTILIATGSFGMGPIEELIKLLGKLSTADCLRAKPGFI